MGETAITCLLSCCSSLFLVGNIRDAALLFPPACCHWICDPFLIRDEDKRKIRTSTSCNIFLKNGAVVLMSWCLEICSGFSHARQLSLLFVLMASQSHMSPRCMKISKEAVIRKEKICRVIFLVHYSLLPKVSRLYCLSIFYSLVIVIRVAVDSKVMFLQVTKEGETQIRLLFFPPLSCH